MNDIVKKKIGQVKLYKDTKLPDFIRMIDKNGIKCYNQLAEGGN